MLCAYAYGRFYHYAAHVLENVKGMLIKPCRRCHPFLADGGNGNTVYERFRAVDAEIKRTQLKNAKQSINIGRLYIHLKMIQTVVHSEASARLDIIAKTAFKSFESATEDNLKDRMHGVLRRMISEVILFVFLGVLFFYLLLLYVT